jgi:competence protein ComEA
MRILVLLATAASLPALALVNVNTAQQSELQRTKGLDPFKAKAIIDYRNQNGPIENFEALLKVPGFGPEVIEKVKPEIAFSGDAFVPPPKAAQTKKGAEPKPAPRKPS